MSKHAWHSHFGDSQESENIFQDLQEAKVKTGWSGVNFKPEIGQMID